MEMKLSRGPWMRRQFAVLCSPTYPSSFSLIPPISHHPFSSINSPPLTHSVSPHSFSGRRRSLSYSAAAAATLQSYLSPPTSSCIISSHIHIHVLLIFFFTCFNCCICFEIIILFFVLIGSEEDSGIAVKGSKVLLKGMRYHEFEKWVQSHGYKPGQALMLWKRLYGNNIWAHYNEELQGLNKDFKRMLNEHAEFKVLQLKDMRTASDGTKKILFTLEDGLVVETVVIPCRRGRTTVCISSQVGCAMNCQFCYTGRQDFHS
ncbi:hypothetical protein BUALT_Bualt17G0044200 [Buddleja alternifolia]|uniref:Radical SAM core domain-containing protein n=1 Tax=Buddleja alternifolia TaxID=168488 RepID=A0AAV6W676_9LAMI|nr:hypothetical protein BUALT_Bualt17G0044200 [Buddleja alternifolia]